MLPIKVKIGNGNGTKKIYYLWEEYNDYEEAEEDAKKMIQEKRRKGEKRIKSFLIPYGPTIIGLYFSRRLRII